MHYYVNAIYAQKIRVLQPIRESKIAFINLNNYKTLISQDWHKYLDKKELFCKRVLEVLESGEQNFFLDIKLLHRINQKQ